MNALETVENILNNPYLTNAGLKFCLVSKDKVPYRIDGEMARPNNESDFVDLDSLLIDDLVNYAGVGISIQASKICAIDVDHCFKVPFDVNSGDERASNILRLFKPVTYCEFSFSGTGLRILFRHDIIDSYSKSYYIKNSKSDIEYYQPVKTSFRYVTLTGKSINSISINNCNTDTLIQFLNTYMLKPVRVSVKTNDLTENNKKSIDLLFELVKHHYLINMNFQNVWFSHAPGSNADESEKDFFLLSYMYAHITTDKEKLKELFERSPYFKSKDYVHRNKWEYNNFRYYNYIYERLSEG